MPSEENYIIENEITDTTKKFLENLLQGKNNELKNRELYIKELFENNN